MMRFLSLPVWVFVAIGVIFTACGDDDPVVGDSPCLDENTTCLSLRLRPDGMTYASQYHISLDRTDHALAWETGNVVVSDYGPGRRVMVTVVFDPALRVRYDHPGQDFFLGAGVPGGVFDRFAGPAVDLDIRGEWTETLRYARCMGLSNAGEPRLELGVGLAPMETGAELRQLTFDFTVPETYDSGGSAGSPVLPGDLELFRLDVRVALDGNSEGDPPVWPGGDYQPPAAVDVSRELR